MDHVPTGAPAFAHASEAELARILDFYEVRWEYEPATFPILFNLDGDVLESFAPDFYLPDADLYLELTTLRQRLVRKKNRKLRRLRELYPEIRIKLFYGRDFRALMLKYGKLALLGELSGTLGQVVPERPEDEDGDAPCGEVRAGAAGLSAADDGADAVSGSGERAGDHGDADRPARSDGRRRRRAGRRLERRSATTVRAEA